MTNQSQTTIDALINDAKEKLLDVDALVVSGDLTELKDIGGAMLNPGDAGGRETSSLVYATRDASKIIDSMIESVYTGAYSEIAKSFGKASMQTSMHSHVFNGFLSQAAANYADFLVERSNELMETPPLEATDDQASEALGIGKTLLAIKQAQEAGRKPLPLFMAAHLPFSAQFHFGMRTDPSAKITMTGCVMVDPRASNEEGVMIIISGPSGE